MQKPRQPRCRLTGLLSLVKVSNQHSRCEQQDTGHLFLEELYVELTRSRFNNMVLMVIKNIEFVNFFTRSSVKKPASLRDLFEGLESAVEKMKTPPVKRGKPARCYSLVQPTSAMIKPKY